MPRLNHVRPIRRNHTQQSLNAFYKSCRFHIADRCLCFKKIIFEKRKPVILIQNDVFPCLAWNGNYFSAKFP